MSTIRIDIRQDADLDHFVSTDDCPPYAFDLMINGLSDSADVEIIRAGYGIPGAVVLHETTATEAALEQIRALAWVADATATN